MSAGSPFRVIYLEPLTGYTPMWGTASSNLAARRKGVVRDHDRAADKGGAAARPVVAAGELITARSSPVSSRESIELT